MTREEKIEFSNQLADLERAVMEINGPYSQTKHALIMLSTFREAWLDDEIFQNCEACSEPIFESEMDTAHSSDDCWFCADCAKSFETEAA